jgi:hypothetical protein
MRQHEERLALAWLAGGLLSLALVVLTVLGAPVLG